MPTVMVSSTYYDLRQIRNDIQEFLTDQLGFECLLSEHPSFPVDPDLDTVENCRRRVQDNADILVLVVGGRYGYVDGSADKSVTNLEYLAARQKRIPIYVFVARNIIDALPIYIRNPGADLSDIVDTSALFDFVRQIREDERAWTFSFDSAQDIIRTLQHQFAHLLDRLLALRSQGGGSQLPQYLEGATAATIKIALETPPAWEYRLLLRMWADHVAGHRGLFREYQAGVAIGVAESVPAESAIDWLLTRSHELVHLISAANDIVNVSAVEALGPPGQPGDAEHIAWVAQALGSVYREVLQWALRVRRARVQDPFAEVARVMSTTADQIISSMTAFPNETLAQIEEGLRVATAENPLTLQATLRFEMANSEELHRALDQARAEYSAM